MLPLSRIETLTMSQPYWPALRTTSLAESSTRVHFVLKRVQLKGCWYLELLNTAGSFAT